MSYYDDDFYYEPSEFDLKVEEFKESLLKSVKENFLSEMERLKKENEELQEVKENFESIQRDYEYKKHQLEAEHRDLKRKVRRERLDELMSDFQVVMYRADYNLESLPKCSNCDDKRRIYYKTPLGKETYESCDCAERKRVYFPKENTCYEFRINRDNDELLAWYKYEDEYGSMSYSTRAETFYEEGMSYEDLENRTFFKSKEECQKYCDWLNLDIGDSNEG